MLYTKNKNKDWSEVASLSNVQDYSASQATAMSEVNIKNPSDYSLTPDQFKA